MAIQNIINRTLGVNFNKQGFAEGRVWAPGAKELLLSTGNLELELDKQEHGYWTLSTEQLKPGDTYWFKVDGKQLPDPASLFQPEGVHGPSGAFDLIAFEWTDDEWRNTALGNYIIYELHTGTFTTDGTFKGIEEKLDYLVSLGITAIEIMPVSQFPGERNWGYDGVFPFATQNSYGGPAGLQALVNTCHSKGLAVILDVVYNHIGPEGDYFAQFGQYFTGKYDTPWGAALNFDDAGCDEVRRYFIENVLMWLRDFHIDALRMDAVHAIRDFSPVHILQEITQHAALLTQQTGKAYYLIAECDLNDARYIKPVQQGGFGFDAQWIDEFHHALRVAAGGERKGYYSDFNGIADLANAYQNGYVYHGQYSGQRQKTFGTKTDGINGQQFVVFSQNHDQIGNRMLGERSSQLFSFDMQKLMAGAVMISPFLPMLFMGEEWSEPNPFQFFVSHTDKELIEAVRKGRKAEFADFHTVGEAPDPQDVNTFNNSKLNWALLDKGQHNVMLRYYKALIKLRKKQPAFKNTDRESITIAVDETAKTLTIKRWTDEQQVLCLLNFSAQEQQVIIPQGTGQWQKLFDSAEPKWNGPLATAEIVSTGQIALSPQSIVIYTQHPA
ncbi:malto-oligosyltrehalose trehalohydrolase [Mucilaginibacter sp. FT3.2]|uniref:malto-oligosyltrehalose trehalohydrolase n=1 Tax=Mucilaginibacter sp. FT3.2 TaxID=2723090 RepID=UPI001609E1D7|nr:malto-oligosyltrehalose trehalohydrolase [Mucilaginibacter sp. FT3.2]MBB6234811.1 maltooligosyltrehalose trehalohydrolase [Mucilaginibacter sp. FT3.2]